MLTKAICALLLMAMAGCATRHAVTQDDSTDEDTEDYITDTYCLPSVNVERSTTQQGHRRPVVPGTDDQPRDLSLLSPASQQIAKVIEVEDLVEQIPILDRDVSQNVPGARLRLLELRQELSDRVLLALFDASSVAAELECEKGRADAVASGMEEIQNNIQQRRTVIALLADATAGLLSGLFLFGGSDTLAGGADIIGNLLQGSFGWAALGGQQQYELRLTRNHLSEVWEGSEFSALFPQSVWRFLNGPVREGRPASRREIIVQEWKKRFTELDTEKGRPRRELFFGEGGTFTGTQLRHRAEMLDRVKASVRLMSKDLNLLFKESLGHIYGIGQVVNSGSQVLD